MSLAPEDAWATSFWLRLELLFLGRGTNLEREILYARSYLRNFKCDVRM